MKAQLFWGRINISFVHFKLVVAAHIFQSRFVVPWFSRRCPMRIQMENVAKMITRELPWSWLRLGSLAAILNKPWGGCIYFALNHFTLTTLTGPLTKSKTQRSECCNTGTRRTKKLSWYLIHDVVCNIFIHESVFCKRLRHLKLCFGSEDAQAERGTRLIIIQPLHTMVQHAQTENAFEIKLLSKYNSLSLTFLITWRQTYNHGAPLGARGNYLVNAAMFRSERRAGNYLSGFSRRPFLPFLLFGALYGLINYESMHRWFIWERGMFKPFFCFPLVHRKPEESSLSYVREVCVAPHYVGEAFNGASQWQRGSALGRWVLWGTDAGVAVLKHATHSQIVTN